MTEFLIRRFVKQADRTDLPEVRQSYGRLGGFTGILLNLFLAGGKFLAGVLTGSIAVTADAFNNLSDAGSSVVTLIGFHLAGKKADADHPFGHGRMEYLSGLFVSALVLLVGVELLKSSVGKILRPVGVEFSWLSVAILAVSVAVKLWMCLFNRNLGKRINSAAMAATATDSLADAVATATVLVGLLVGHFFQLTIDGWVGLAVSAFVLKAGWGAVKDTLDPLLGKPADPQLVEAIQADVLAHEEIIGIHDLVLHDYGPGRRMMSFHAEVPADMDVMLAHDVIDNVERQLHRTYAIETVIHMDPVRLDEETQSLRERVEGLVRELDPAFTIHDFRITAGPSHTNLIFDVVVPNDCPMDEVQVRTAIRQAVTQLDDGTYYAVIQVDRLY